MPIVKYALDPANPPNPPKMSAETQARLEALTDEGITAAAMSDPNNPPLTEAEFRRIKAIEVARRARAAAKLSRDRFAQV
jgi:putative transcriptional regulator